MQDRIKVYRENYADLPKRFVRKIEQDIEYILAAKIPGLEKIYLFGSCAKGEVRSTSDVDLLILTREEMRDRELAADIRWSLEEPLEGVKTDVVYMNRASVMERSAFKDAVNGSRKTIVEVLE